ncbi:MAG: hypothetical protein KatS3mg111_4150 [Pirellulaceae bacterium]|nr:MAG: hypothetical protein KatS3mg111_4150 [Pirellulaceae bacterium]
MKFNLRPGDVPSCTGRGMRPMLLLGRAGLALWAICSSAGPFNQASAQSPHHSAPSHPSAIPLGVPCVFYPTATSPVTSVRSRRVDLPPLRPTVAEPVAVSVAFNGDGTLLGVAGDDHTIRIVATDSATQIACLIGHQDWVRSLVWRNDSNGLVSAGDDGRILRWGVAAGDKRWQATEICQFPYRISSVVPRPGSDELAVVGFSTEVSFVDGTSGAVRRTIKRDRRDTACLAFDPSGKVLVIGDQLGNVEIWDVAMEKRLHRLSGHSRRVRAVAMGPGGARFSTAGEDGRVVQWSLADANPIWQSNRLAARLQSLVWIDGELLAAGGADNAIHLIDASTGQEMAVLHGHVGSVVDLETHGDRLASCSFDATVRFWDGVHQMLQERKHLTRPVSRIEPENVDVR